MILNDNHLGTGIDARALPFNQRNSLGGGRGGTGYFVSSFRQEQTLTRVFGGASVLGSTGLLGSFALAAQRRRDSNDEGPARAQNVKIYSASEPFRRKHISNQENNGWLKEVVEEWGQIDAEAAEEGFSPVSESAKQNALNIVKGLAKGPYPQPVIYPTADGEVAILFQQKKTKSGVLILCDGSGGGSCFSTIGGKNQRARYDDAADLPDEFIRDQLLKLKLAA